MLLVIDNYDSFTFNLVQYLGELKADVLVHRNDEVTLEQIEADKPERILVSPGPCTPREAGLSIDVIKHFAGKLPIMGVCLGHQCIGQAYGGEVVVNYRMMHGKTSPITHRGKDLLNYLEYFFSNKSNIDFSKKSKIDFSKNSKIDFSKNLNRFF